MAINFSIERQRNMAIKLAPALLMLAISAMAGAQPPANFFVSPRGHDSWSGRLATPNASGSDGPFATLGRAQKAARAVSGGGTNGVIVKLRGGTYDLAAPFFFTPEDSGSAGNPVVYAAYPGEHPVLSGALRIDGWTRTASGAWQTVVPQGVATQVLWGPGGLYVNGHRRERPRLPISGYFTVATTTPASPAAEGKGFDTLGYKPGDIDPKWANLGDVEVLPFHIWTMSRFKVKSINDAIHTLTWSGCTPGQQEYFGAGQGHRYLIENVKEALTPGTWYFDRSNRVLTYDPLSGEDVRSAEIVAPRLEQLVIFKGEPAQNRHVHDVVLRGLTMAFTGWQTPTGGHSFAQADIDVSSAINAAYVSHCNIEDCRIIHTGGWALDVEDGCSNISISGCDLLDLGAGGVKIGGEQTTHDISVEETNIAHCGRIHPAAVGVWIGHSSNNRIAHDTISDLYYTGISVGWSWGYEPSKAHHNIIVDNRIEHIGQGVLSDMGGIYTLGVSPGSVVSHNWIEDVRSYDYGGWGIYFDEGSSDILATNNIVFKVKSAGLHQHYGKDNDLFNNIFAYGESAQIQRSRAEDHLSFTFDRNIILFDNRPLFAGTWDDRAGYKLAGNIYWQGAAHADADRHDLAFRQSGGQDIGSVIADPMFVDPLHGNFRLRATSPAFDMGFNEIDMTGMGSRRKLTPFADPPAFPVGLSSS
jgi:hypothetical protein